MSNELTSDGSSGTVSEPRVAKKLSIPMIETDWSELRTKIELVREIRMLFGHRRAAELAADLGLPGASPMNAPAPRMVTALASESVRAFLEERTVQSPGARINSSVLFQAFQSWGKHNAAGITLTAFGRAMGVLGVRKQLSSVVYYCGIALAES